MLIEPILTGVAQLIGTILAIDEGACDERSEAVAQQSGPSTTPTSGTSSGWSRRRSARGSRISLCLPTLNEEKTIGQEIVILKAELTDRYPLLDEIAVVDSGCTDQTCEIAAEFGADVYVASEHLHRVRQPTAARARTSGRPSTCSRGDIIVYVDADIENIHPRFVYGLVGPLIPNPEVHYVKAFYDRPIAFSGGLRPTGGGRVTEILIRPLFSLFYPELAAILQPLSGEYAGRRSILEQIPFPVGYGVETAMLIDIYQRLGHGRLRPDRPGPPRPPQPGDDRPGPHGLRRAADLHVAAAARPAVQLQDELPSIMRQFEVGDGTYRQVEHHIEEIERQPIIEVEAYRQKFHPPE